MLLKISWRNVWRNRLRSGVVIAAIALGIWAGLFVMALSVGLNNQRTRSAISTTLSHIQLHNPAYLKDSKVANFIPDGEHVTQVLEANPQVKAFTTRMIVNGMASSSAGGFGVSLNGIDPEKEARVTDIHDHLTEGDWFAEGKRNQVVIGAKLADKLKVKLRSKIVLNFQNEQGDIVAGAFRVAGIFKTVSSQYDESTAFVRMKDLEGLLGTPGQFHEVALLTSGLDEVQPVKEELKAALPDLEVRAWKDVSPELGYADEMMNTMLYIFILIILMALGFGIINTMLMAVLERKRELGMLMSVGMNRVRTFSMIVIETVFLSLIGGPVGILLGWATISWVHSKGLDLSAVGKGLESLGVGAIIYPELESGIYFNIAILVVVAAILASIVPAIRALMYKPAEAVRGL
ncbi:MAG: ABC transporter permease [Bacteroidia bacterium]|nr:ABC transporter permease [Bacteroidia bacterium]